ncbi:MAG: hypothetical protein ACU0CA_15275 [Paracoccaceae bacterium]
MPFVKPFETPEPKIADIKYLYENWCRLREDADTGNADPRKEVLKFREMRSHEACLAALPAFSVEDFARKIIVLGERRPVNGSDIAESLFKDAQNLLGEVQQRPDPLV